MAVGIEKINLYGGRFYLDAVELATLYGKDTRQIMAEQRSVVPPVEDAVTLAVNAAKRLLADEDRKDIELVIVASESAVDFSKSTSTWVHRFCGLPSNCRSFEVKHACYGATGALKMALAWVASEARPGKKALLISTDLTRADLLKSGFDFIGGGSAVAMLISQNPQVLEVDPRRAGYWTYEISDTHRPTSTHEIVHNEKSLYSYLDALDGAFDHYESVNGKVDYDRYFKKHIYHAPFPGMTLQAHQAMLNRYEIFDKAAVLKSFQEKVEGSISWSKRLGTAYGASNFICLMSLLHASHDLQPKDRISVFAYGSGCQGEFYEASVGAGAPENVRAQAIDKHIDARHRVSVDQYRWLENARQALIDLENCRPDMGELEPEYKRLYEGQGLLVLKGVENYERRYDWS